MITEIFYALADSNPYFFLRVFINNVLYLLL